MEEESYFFFLDLDPRALYEHPVKYITVARSDGSYGVTDAGWWPKIDGATPAEFLQSIPESAYVVEDTANLPAPVEESLEFPIPDLNLVRKEGFIVVQGSMPGERLHDELVSTCEDVRDFFDAYRNSFSRVELISEAQAIDFPAVIDDMADDGIDMITMYVLAHGSPDKVGVSGYGVPPGYFRNAIAAHPDILFNFLLGACHGGSFIDDLQTLDNMRVVMTATSTDLNAWPDWDYADGLTDYNTMDSGTEWTSSILWAGIVITTNPDFFSVVEDWAGTYGIPETCELLYQMHRGAIGENNPMNLYYNLDLSYRTGDAAPQIYHSWRRLD